MTDRELMELHERGAFVHDARGRMVSTNEPLPTARRDAPRLFIGDTAGGRVIRYGARLSDAMVAELDALAGDRDAMLAVLARDAPAVEYGGGPVYRFPDPITAGGGVEVAPIAAEHLALAHGRFAWLIDEWQDWGPCHVAIRDDAIVAACFSARIDRDVDQAGVETLAPYRGRGLATAVTAAWARAVRAAGRIPLYSTSNANVASQGVARRLGLVEVGRDATWS